MVTPVDAVGLGADYLVIGRPITQSPDPRATLDAIRRSLEGGPSPQPSPKGEGANVGKGFAR